jgi:hypothetical protein
VEPVSVAVVTCLYGEGYQRFVRPWLAAVRGLNTRPDEIIIATDRGYIIDGADITAARCTWAHPQAFHLQEAFETATSEWVWKLDLDDVALPDALDGLDEVSADVWQMGYLRTDGLRHIPPQLSATEFLLSTGNPFVSSSAVRRRAFQRCGGYPDIAFEDWGLWRRLALAGCTFESSGRPHFRYTQGSYTRTAVELVTSERSRHVEEMHLSERG